jgi:hypothetical protein
VSRRGTWSYRGIPILVRRWTWRHALCVRVLLLFWPPYKAYTFARKHL